MTATTWTQRGDLPVGYSAVDICSSGTRLVAACYAGKIATSDDALTWTARTFPNSGLATAAMAVTWNGDFFCAIASGTRTVWTSTDGITWLSHANALPEATLWCSIAWNGTAFCALGAYDGGSGRLATSPDGVTWTARTPAISSGVQVIAVGTKFWVIGGINNQTKYSIDDGASWTYANTFHGASNASIATDGTEVCILGSNSAYGLHSTAGATAFGSKNVLTGLSYAGGSIGYSGDAFWVLGVYGNGTAYTDDHGVTWQAGGNLPVSDGSTSTMARLGTKLVAASGNVTMTVDAPFYVPPTGFEVKSSTWLGGYFPAAYGRYNDSACGNGVFVSVNQDGGAYSRDGAHWYRANMPASPGGQGWMVVIFNGTKFITVGGNVSGTMHVAESYDGINWALVTTAGIPVASYYTTRAGVWTGTHFCVMCDNPLFSLRSTDGVTWERTVLADPGTSPIFTGLAYNGSTLVATEQIGFVQTSPATGTPTWTRRACGTGFLADVVSDGSGFIVVPNSGPLLTSPDGVTWTNSANAPTRGNPGLVANSGSRLVAAGANRVITSDTEGATWIERSGIHPTQPPYGLCWQGARFVTSLGGTFGLYTSTDGTAWTQRNTTNIGYQIWFAFNGLIGVAVGDSGSSILRTTDGGLTWATVSPGGFPSSLKNVTWNGTLFVCLHFGGDVWTSPDGSTWTYRTNLGTHSWRYFAKKGTTLLAIGGSPVYTSVSADGITWSTPLALSVSASAFPYPVFESASGFVLAVTDGFAATQRLASVDGLVWNATVMDLPMLGQLFQHLPRHGAAISGGRYITMDKGALITSDLGASWQLTHINFSEVIFKATYAAGKYRLTGRGNLMHISADGLTWADELLPVISDYGDALYGRGTTVVAAFEPYGYVSGSNAAFAVDRFANPPAATDEIVFEALTESPDTGGVGAGALRLSAYGTYAATWGVGALRLSSSGSGTYVSRITGTGVAVLPLLRAQGLEPHVDIPVTYEGWGIARVPSLSSDAVDNTAFVPNGGSGDGSLRLSTSGAGGGSIWGSGSGSINLWGFGSEVGGNYGLASLPKLRAGGGNLPAPVNRAVLISATPMMQVYGSNTWVVEEGISLATALVPMSIKVLRDSILAAEQVSPRRERFATATDEVAYTEALAVAWHIALAEEVALAGTAAASLSKVAAIADSLHASGLVATRVDALAVVSTALAVNTLLATGWKMSAVGTIDFQDALQSQLEHIAKLVSMAGFGGIAGASMRISVLVSDSIALADGLATTLEAFEKLADGVQFYATFRLGEAEYAGWVMNEGAASEYRNYPFNGFVNFAGKYYGTADDGFYLLEGEDDQGDPIEAWIKTALMDFGTGKLKKVPDVYVGFIGGNKMVLRVITTNAGVQTEHHYTTTVPAGDAMHNGRIEVGRGLESRYWQFQLCNVDGAEFELDDIVWRPVMLDRRI